MSEGHLGTLLMHGSFPQVCLISKGTMGTAEEQTCQTLILFTFHLFTLHGLHFLSGIINYYKGEITLCENSSIFALEKPSL